MKRLAVFQMALTLALSVCARSQQPSPLPRVVTGPLSLDQAVQTALRESPLLKGQSAEVEAARSHWRRVLALA